MSNLDDAMQIKVDTLINEYEAILDRPITVTTGLGNTYNVLGGDTNLNRMTHYLNTKVRLGDTTGHLILADAPPVEVLLSEYQEIKEGICNYVKGIYDNNLIPKIVEVFSCTTVEEVLLIGGLND